MSQYPYQEVTTLRKSGQTDAAYRRGQELIRQHPNDKYLRSSYGWVLYDMLKQLYEASSKDSPDSTVSHSRIRNLLHEYAHQNLDRPDLLFSVIVALLLRFKNMPEFFPKFLHWAGTQSFREEDFQTSSMEDKTFPSLVENLAVGVAKQVISNWVHYDRQVHEFVLELTDLAINQCEVSDPLWLRYRKGQLLCRWGRHKEAREHLEYTVKRKRGEYWAWHALAGCERISSPARALALCVKAYMVAVDKKFTVSVLEDIIQLALDAKDVELARWAVDTVFSIRKNAEWKLPEFISTCISSDWYAKSSALENPEPILAKYAESAESFLFEGNWQMASLLEVFTSNKGKDLIKLVYKTDTDTSTEVVVPARLYPAIADMKPGTPLLAAIESGEKRGQILALKTREQGNAFDCLMQVRGILDHHNNAKKLAFVFMGHSDSCLLYYSEFKKVQNWEPGTALIMSYTFKKKYHIYKVSRTTPWESEWVCYKTGTLRVHQRGFGFVGDMFVPPYLIKKEWGKIQVSVIALKKPNKRDPKNQLGWQVISIKPVESE